MPEKYTVKVYKDAFWNTARIERIQLFPYIGAKNKEDGFRLRVSSDNNDNLVYAVSVHETLAQAEQKLREFSAGTFEEVKETRAIWARLGVFIYATETEINGLVRGSDNNEAILSKIFSEGRVKIDGDSYIPEDVIANYNQKHGTTYRNVDVELNTSRLDDKYIYAI